MIRKFSHASVTFMRKYVPDAFVIAVGLTMVVFLLGMLYTSQGPVAMLTHWETGFWKLLAFSMQMTLIIVTGHTLASSVPVRALLSKIAGLISRPFLCVLVVTGVSLLASWVHWGFGLVVGAFIAKEVASRNKHVHYPLLVASAYSGFLVWHAGLSGSIPLRLARGKDLGNFTHGVLTEGIPTTLTIFSTSTILLVLFVSLAVAVGNVLMCPKSGIIPYSDLAVELPVQKAEMPKTPAQKWEHSRAFNGIFCLMGFSVIVLYFVRNGLEINLNIVNFIFLFLSMAFHKTLKNFLNAANEAIKGVSGVVLQFPLYAGIMGMMTGAGSDGSLASMISDFFVSLSTKETFPFFTFLSAGVVNIFVPSGGGQFVVQGPIVMPAALKLGVEPAKAAMAIAWGDAWTNMIQPFWALPLLAIAKISVSDIMGYCLTALLISGVVIGVGILVL